MRKRFLQRWSKPTNEFGAKGVDKAMSRSEQKIQ